MFGQMGTLLTDFLPMLSQVLIKGVISLSKIFSASLKALKMDKNEEDKTGESDEEMDQNIQVYRKAGD